jgi:high-affinity Fe2+/Pb2+ permease
MFIGFAAILKPISTLGSVIPFLGNVLGAGTSIIAFLLAFIISFVVIAIAWIFFRPILGISLLVIAGAAFYFGKKHFSKEPVAETKKIPEEDGYQK